MEEYPRGVAGKKRMEEAHKQTIKFRPISYLEKVSSSLIQILAANQDRWDIKLTFEDWF